MKPEVEQKFKPKVSDINGIKIRVQINEAENRRLIEKKKSIKPKICSLKRSIKLKTSIQAKEKKIT